MARQFGLIGHGVVGSLFARLLREGGALVISYDILLDHPETEGGMRRKILSDGARPGSLEETIRESEYVLAAATTETCRDAAARAGRYLHAGQIYCDFASTSPALKREMASIVQATGARFVEGAILGAAGTSPVSPEILLGGEEATNAAATLQEYRLRVRPYSREIGPASAFKMIRSVFSKGMETLLIETLLAARRANLLGDVWQEIRMTLAPGCMERTLEIWVRSHRGSAARRYGEMLEVSRFLEELDLEPIVTRAAAEVFRRSKALAMAEPAAGAPLPLPDVIESLDRELLKSSSRN